VVDPEVGPAAASRAWYSSSVTRPIASRRRSLYRSVGRSARNRCSARACLARVALSVEALRPDRAWLGEPQPGVDGEQWDEDAEQGVHESVLGGGDQHPAEVPRRRRHGRRQHRGRIVVDPRGHKREQHEPEQAQRDQRRVDRAAACAGPVDIVEVEPQGVLVDGETEADAEEHRVNRIPGTVGLPYREAKPTGHHHQHDPEEEVVHMHAALGHDAAWPPRHARTAHQTGGKADEPERAHEADQGQQEEPARSARLPHASPMTEANAASIDLASPISAGAARPGPQLRRAYAESHPPGLPPDDHRPARPPERR
jgi:hypothetical protein